MIVMSDDIIRVMESEIEGQGKSMALISAFYDKLSSLARTPNPIRPPVPHCDRCTAMQSDPLLWTGQRAVTVRWGTVADLKGTATASCPLCRLLFKPLFMELEAKRKGFEDEGEVTIRFNDTMCQVRCGGMSRLFVVKSLAGKTLLLFHWKAIPPLHVCLPYLT